MKIIATSLRGLFIKSCAWSNADKVWFENASKKLDDVSILKWIGKEDYFEGVEEVMEQLLPYATNKKRIVEARKRFFKIVVSNIKHNQINEEVVAFFCSLKKDFKIALITTNTDDVVNVILEKVGLKGVFDFVETSKIEEKDDKEIVFERFLKKHGKPFLYVGGEKEVSYEFCKDRSIRSVFLNLEGFEPFENVEMVTSVEALSEHINSLP